ncbi:GFA family protein [Sulfitobacter sp. LCG007]
MTGIFAGGCLCGRVRYEAAGPALFGGLCHCRSCQRVSGGGHLPVMGVATSGMSVSGDPARHSMAGGSGMQTHRHFCPGCGSTLFGTSDSDPDLATLYVGSLDDPSVFQPSAAINARERQPWDTGGRDLHSFDGMPA